MPLKFAECLVPLAIIAHQTSQTARLDNPSTCNCPIKEASRMRENNSNMYGSNEFRSEHTHAYRTLIAHCGLMSNDTNTMCASTRQAADVQEEPDDCLLYTSDAADE
eukprot:2403496-Heterocapsa_arctica.AAC.1